MSVLPSKNPSTAIILRIHKESLPFLGVFERAVFDTLLEQGKAGFVESGV